MTTTAGRRLRPVRIAPIEALVRFGPDGSVFMQSPTPLGPYPTRITDRLDDWAERTPDRVFLAQRVPSGEWRTVTYQQARTRARRLAQAIEWMAEGKSRNWKYERRA